MLSNWSVCRSGAHPPKNEAGTTGGILSWDPRNRYVSAGNGRCICAKTFSDCEPGISRYNLYMRSVCSNVAKILSMPHFLWPALYTKIGNSGQIFNIFLVGVLALQQSRRFKRCGEPKTTFRHFWHTCTSLCHASIAASRR